MRRLALALPLAAAALALAPSVARACGGTVCDAGPNQMPVDQTGENVLFVLQPGEVEVHIQIAYDPETNAQKFAWLIPLPEVPEFAVGSELLFQELLRASVPTYGLNTTLEQCGEASDGNASGDPGGFITPFDAGGGNSPDVVLQQVVGAFEVVVLAGKSAPEILQWLGDNGFQQDENAAPILQQYLDEGNHVVAFKLAHDEGVSSIHPIVLRLAAPDGCVPIRLTRIAAVDDMDVRVFALADGRAIPTNYRHVLVNPLKIDWLNLGANYKEVISLAVDAFGADGHAFVTEYAGPSDVVDPDAFDLAQWHDAPLADLQPTQVIDTLNAYALTACGPGECLFRHPLVEGVLARYLPVPDGLEPAEFYACLDCYADQIDLAAWGDGTGFHKDMIERVLEPAAHARTLLATWPTLSRLYTTISPSEMTEDPIFLINPDLGDVPNVRTAERYVRCDDIDVVTLPDGREVLMQSGADWPDFPGEMPWEEDVDQMAPKGMPQPLVDNTALIDAMLAEWNAQFPAGPGTTGDPTGGDPTGGATGAATGGATTGGGSTGADADAATGGEHSGGTSGCGCRSQAPGGLPLLLGLLALARRRRSR